MIKAHKCDGCRYKGEHQEMMFRPMGVCNRGANLVEAVQNYEAEKCPYKKTNGDRMRGMSDIELAEFLADKFVEIACMPLDSEYHNLTEIEKEALKSNVRHNLIYWLRQPAEEGQK